MAMRMEDRREIREHYEEVEDSEDDEPTADDLDWLEADIRTVDIDAWSERAWQLSEQMRCGLEDAALATITMDAGPF